MNFSWTANPSNWFDTQAAEIFSAMKRPFEIAVSCHTGHKGEQTPKSFAFREKTIFVEEILDQWLAPDHRYFKLKAQDGVYILRHDTQGSLWELVFYWKGP